jgi:hypothetical protein
MFNKNRIKDELKCDIAIIGGGLGGCAAALAALKQGMRVVLTEPTDWIGGQLTSQAVPPDENHAIDTHGANASYRLLRSKIRDYYRRNYPLNESCRHSPILNPGNGLVSGLCHEPRVALAALEEMFACYVSSGRLQVWTRTRPLAAEMHGDHVQAVVVEKNDGRRIRIGAKIFIDATEAGDLLPLSGTEYVTGTESQVETGELHAPSTARPQNMQAFTWCFAMEYCPGQDHSIPEPRDWRFWKDYVPDLNPAWPGRLLSFEGAHPETLQKRHWSLKPHEPGGLFHFRRLIDHSLYTYQLHRGDTTLVNWPQNDYMLGNPFECSAEESEKHLEGSKQLSLSLLYWLQNEAPREDGGAGWKGLRPRGDLLGTDDGLAMAPYLRESRRIRSECTILEQYVGKLARRDLSKGAADHAEVFFDSIGIGSYRIDLHPSTQGDNYIDVESLPFQIPLGALLPVRVENLLPACKNIGTTHITNGCYRLHPVEWAIGEAAGSLAAYACAASEPPRAIRASQKHLADFQNSLVKQGIPLAWK